MQRRMTGGKDKQARPDTYGEGFVYDSVKFNALQDELARAEFLDVDNTFHFPVEEFLLR